MYGVVVIFLALRLSSAVVVRDDNAIVELAFDNYYRVLNASGQLPSCKLEIIRGGPEGSVIQPFTGWRGNVALVAQAGPGCKITDKYLCAVNWGDPQSDQTYTQLDGLLPCQQTKQYEKVNRPYRIQAMYCTAVTTSSGVQAGYCSNYIRIIDTSYDPANPLNETRANRGEL